ncbi:MAG: hypothetical protein K6G56_06210 [Clostridiales bacterium]|nr:hypothetical protein [Clostridiales bacterium]
MKTIRIIFAALILAACLVPSVLMICGYKNPNKENRKLASLPKLVTEDGANTEFASQFDKYVNDNFAFRDHLVAAFNDVDIALLRDFNGTNAIIGRKNHIFYGPTLNDYLGVEQLTEEQIASIANFLADYSAALAEKGVRFTFMTAPNKATIYPEYMPGYLKPTDNSRNIDMLNTALAERNVDFIDAKSILIPAKEQRTIYYEHDSHWNNFGAILIYNEIAEHFGLEKYDPETYTVVNDRTGDLHNFVYPASSYKEERIVYPEFHSYSSKRPVNFDRDKTVDTTSDVNEIRMVFYHDSFGRSLQPFISQSVGALHMNSYFPYKADVIDKYDPDIVLIELVERNLDKLYEYAVSLGY